MFKNCPKTEILAFIHINKLFLFHTLLFPFSECSLVFQRFAVAIENQNQQNPTTSSTPKS